MFWHILSWVWLSPSLRRSHCFRLFPIIHFAFLAIEIHRHTALCAQCSQCDLHIPNINTIKTHIAFNQLLWVNWTSLGADPYSRAKFFSWLYSIPQVDSDLPILTDVSLFWFLFFYYYTLASYSFFFHLFCWWQPIWQCQCSYLQKQCY